MLLERLPELPDEPDLRPDEEELLPRREDDVELERELPDLDEVLPADDELERLLDLLLDVDVLLELLDDEVFFELLRLLFVDVVFVTVLAERSALPSV